MSVENLQERLEAAAATFADTPAQSGSIYDAPPDGDYHSLIHEFDWFDGGTPKQAWIKVRFIVLSDIEDDTAYSGRMAETIASLEDPDKFGRLKYLFEQLGSEAVLGRDIELTDLMPNTDLIRGLLDTPILIRVKRSDRLDKNGNPYVNVYVEEREGEPGSGENPTEPQQHTDAPAAEGDFVHPQQAKLGDQAGAKDDDDIPF